MGDSTVPAEEWRGFRWLCAPRVRAVPAVCPRHRPHATAHWRSVLTSTTASSSPLRQLPPHHLPQLPPHLFQTPPSAPQGLLLLVVLLLLLKLLGPGLLPGVSSQEPQAPQSQCEHQEGEAP